MDTTRSTTGDVRDWRWSPYFTWAPAAMMLLWSIMEIWVLITYMHGTPGSSFGSRFVLFVFILPVIVLPLLFILAMEARRPWRAALLGVAALAVMAWEWAIVVTTLGVPVVPMLGDGRWAESFKIWLDCAEVYAFLLPLVGVLLLVRGCVATWRTVRPIWRRGVA